MTVTHSCVTCSCVEHTLISTGRASAGSDHTSVFCRIRNIISNITNSQWFANVIRLTLALNIIFIIYVVDWRLNDLSPSLYVSMEI